MATIHGWLGLGEFPDQPITIYLARSTSLLYAVHGALMLDCFVRPRTILATCTGIWMVARIIGVVMLAIDLTTPMPWYWTAIEGIPIAIAGLMIVWLYRQANHRVG